jgi:predicted TIM-barrel fold metal-dependent hydrolase
MKIPYSLIRLSLLLAGLPAACVQPGKQPAQPPETTTEFYTANDFLRVEKFDSHVHLNTYDSTYLKQAESDNFRLLDIVDDRPFGITMEEQEKIALHHTRKFPERVLYATTFSTRNWGSPGWEPAALRHLQQAIANGAVAVKIWKNIGMGLKDADGKFVMVDDPRFDTILNYLEANNIPLIGHLGEPRNAWLPLDSMTINGDRRYFGEHPEYHMYRHPEYPSYEAQISARDHMLEKHPRLRFIAAHLGSLEWNLDSAAARLDRFPNMAMDLARMSHLRLHAANDRERTRSFFIKYQDRLLYATDPQIGDTYDTAATHESRLRNWKFFATDEEMKDPDVKGTFKGLQLPKEVINKIYRENAARWLFPAAPLKAVSTRDFRVSGDGSDTNWRRAPWVAIPQRTAAGGAFATKVKVLHSATGLYFLFSCADKRLSTSMNADFMDLWKEDVVEVFLQPDAGTPDYFEYELSPMNFELPILISNRNGDIVRWQPFHYDADRRTQHATAIQGGPREHKAAVSSWTAEFFIPYKLLRPLRNIPPKAGDRWKINLYRVDYDAGEDSWSWQLTGPSFHEHDKFGDLLFE